MRSLVVGMFSEITGCRSEVLVEMRVLNHFFKCFLLALGTRFLAWSGEARWIRQVDLNLSLNHNVELVSFLT